MAAVPHSRYPCLPLIKAPYPRPRMDRRAKSVDAARPQQLIGLSILVVDDEADARAVVAEALRLEARASRQATVRALRWPISSSRGVTSIFW